ncbi:hypothetical protein ACFX15_027442 [Malus domestica]
MPRIDDLYNQLYRTRAFFEIDLKFGCNQLKIRNDDVPKTTFRTQHVHCEFLVMSCGLTNAPTLFMNLTDGAFRLCPERFGITLLRTSLFTPIMKSNFLNTDDLI